MFHLITLVNLALNYSVKQQKLVSLKQRARVNNRLFLASDFLKMCSCLFCVVDIHIIKAICHCFQIIDQTSVGTFDVAMETLENKVKMHFFLIFYMFLLFSEILIKIAIPHHPRTNTKLLL